MKSLGSVIEKFNNQDKKQKILLGVLVLVFSVTVVVVYSNFFKNPNTVTQINPIGKLEPLNINLKILDSEVFNNLKSN